MLRVVSAAIVRNRRLLLTQRAKKGAQPLTWETPGGKVEPGESDVDALLREIAEEMCDGFEPGYPKVGKVVAEMVIGPPDLPEPIILII
jgi:8-oxo-dGTP diphosphatase